MCTSQPSPPRPRNVIFPLITRRPGKNEEVAPGCVLPRGGVGSFWLGGAVGAEGVQDHGLTGLGGREWHLPNPTYVHRR